MWYLRSVTCLSEPQFLQVYKSFYLRGHCGDWRVWLRAHTDPEVAQVESLLGKGSAFVFSRGRLCAVTGGQGWGACGLWVGDTSPWDLCAALPGVGSLNLSLPP